MWLDFVRAASAACPGAAAHGDLAEGFSAEGDVDLLVARGEWPCLEEVFAQWAERHGLMPALSCRHRAGVLVLVAVGPHDVFYEVEARAERFFRGARLFSAEDFGALAIDDPAGFRRLRPGAAGIVKLFPSGLGRLGRPAWRGAKLDRVRRLLAEDRDGAERAAGLLGLAARPARSGAAAVAAGGWNRRAMLAVEAMCAASALLRLPTLVARARFRFGAERDCVILRAVREHGRRIPGDRAGWLAEAAATHPILDTRPRCEGA